MIMFEQILIPLLLSDILGQLKGKTRFQKLVYIVQDEAKTKAIQACPFHYGLSHYGPFSTELSSMLDTLKNRGLIDEEMEQTPAGYTRYVYSITEEGRSLLRHATKKKLVSKGLKKIIDNVADEYGEIPLQEVVDEAYHRYFL